MTRLAIAITTAPRPRPTLQESYRSLRERGGFRDHVHVFSDRPDPSLELGVLADVGRDTIYVNDPPLGGLKNFAHALEWTLHVEPEARWVLMLEDDILWAFGARDALDRDMDHLERHRKGTGYLSLYLSRKVSKPLENMTGGSLRNGMHRSHISDQCWGSQAYLMPREAAEALLAWPEFIDRRANYVKNRNRDNIVSGCFDRMHRSLLYRVPSLVSHELGSANSSLGDKPVQRSLLTDYWTGFP